MRGVAAGSQGILLEFCWLFHGSSCGFGVFFGFLLKLEARLCEARVSENPSRWKHYKKSRRIPKNDLHYHVTNKSNKPRPKLSKFSL